MLKSVSSRQHLTSEVAKVGSSQAWGLSTGKTFQNAECALEVGFWLGWGLNGSWETARALPHIKQSVSETLVRVEQIRWCLPHTFSKPPKCKNNIERTTHPAPRRQSQTDWHSFSHLTTKPLRPFTQSSDVFCATSLKPKIIAIFSASERSDTALAEQNALHTCFVLMLHQSSGRSIAHVIHNGPSILFIKFPDWAAWNMT